MIEFVSNRSKIRYPVKRGEGGKMAIRVSGNDWGLYPSSNFPGSYVALRRGDLFATGKIRVKASSREVTEWKMWPWMHDPSLEDFPFAPEGSSIEVKRSTFLGLVTHYRIVGPVRCALCNGNGYTGCATETFNTCPCVSQ